MCCEMRKQTTHINEDDGLDNFRTTKEKDEERQ